MIDADQGAEPKGGPSMSAGNSGSVRAGREFLFAYFAWFAVTFLAQ
jgi:hypothetical protein